MNSLKEKDHKVQMILGNLLLVGVITAAGVVLFGGILYLFQEGNEIPQYADFKEKSGSLMPISGMVEGLKNLKSMAILQLGILILIATPVMRVIFSIVAFFYEKDYLYIFFTLIVLVILMYSLFL